MKKYFKLIVVVIILGTRFLGIQCIDNRNIVLAKPRLFLSSYPPPGPSFISNVKRTEDEIYKPKRSRAKYNRFIRNRRENDGGWSGLGSRFLNSIAPGNLLGSSTNNDDRYAAYDDDQYASPTGYGHGGGGGYGGGGGHGGGGHGGGYGKGSLNSSAVGLLGFLSLLSLIQTVLNQTTTTAAPAGGGRKKRDYDAERMEKGDLKDTASPTQADKIIQLLLPVLSAIAHARDELIPVECTLRQVCLANQILIRELGVPGRSVGNMLSDGIGRILKEVDKSGKVFPLVKKAGKAGRIGKKCHRIYHECPIITHLPHYFIPASMTF